MKDKPQAEETDYVKAAKKGDLNAFKILVEQNKDILLTLACSILKDRILAEDVLQEALIKVYHKIRQFKEKSSFRTWLYRIVINTSYNALKKQQAYRQLKETATPQKAKGIDSGTHVNIQDQKKYIQLALNQLKADEALVLRLYYLCEFSVAEISEATGFRKSKIKTNLFRGRNNLKQQLNKLLGNELKELL